jgi:RNA polymerase sigma-70 factor (ECF subfamily)
MVSASIAHCEDMGPPGAESSERRDLALTVPTAVPTLTAQSLYEEYLRPVFRHVSRSIENRADAEDVTLEVFTAAFQQLHRFRGECDPYLWLLGIARRKMADHWRRSGRRRERPMAELPEDCSLATAPSTGQDGPSDRDAADAAAIRLLVGRLKEDQRVALLLKYVEGLSTAEVAVVMRKSPTAVNSLLQRARARLLREGLSYFGAEPLRAVDGK